MSFREPMRGDARCKVCRTTRHAGRSSRHAGPCSAAPVAPTPAAGAQWHGAVPWRKAVPMTLHANPAARRSRRFVLPFLLPVVIALGPGPAPAATGRQVTAAVEGLGSRDAAV